jgi:hypothetical protein
VIVNHRHKFIFVKTRKTAGTSIEIALSPFCGPRDVITPITPEDEQVRRALGYRGPQNYRLPLRKYSREDVVARLAGRPSRDFYNHMPAAEIRRRVGRKVWFAYYKFAVERNPFDKALSSYYWYTRKTPERSFSEWLATTPVERVCNYDMYAVNGALVVDRVLRYENLAKEIREVFAQLGLPEDLELPRVKSGVRRDDRHYREVLTPEEARTLSIICAREIALFGYEF